MNAAWELPIPHGMKFVLVSLCDQASDTGDCFPAIMTISKRCSMGERTVQGHIKSLENDGYLSRIERLGRSTLYKLNPRRICTPADFAPPQETTKTPADFAQTPANSAGAPADSAPITTTKPPIEPLVTINTGLLMRPDQVQEQVWLDFVQLRKARRAALTKTALDGIEREALKAGLSLEQALRMCCERGWQGFEAKWLIDKPKVNGSGEDIFEKNRRVAEEWAKGPMQ